MHVKGVSHSDEPEENHHLSLLFPSDLSSHCFSITACNLSALVHSYGSHQRHL